MTNLSLSSHGVSAPEPRYSTALDLDCRSLSGTWIAFQNRKIMGRLAQTTGRALRVLASFGLIAAALICRADPAATAGHGLSGEQGKAGITNLLALAQDQNARNDIRVRAIESLGRTSFGQAGSTLLSVLGRRQPVSVQLASLAALDRFKDPQVGSELIKKWEMLIPDLRDQALPMLLGFPDRASALLQAIKAESIPASTLSTAQVEFLRAHRDEHVRQLATEVLPMAASNERQQALEAFMPALKVQGHMTHGYSIFEERCSACHSLRGEGYAVGPDLAKTDLGGKEKILTNILDPNREVRPEFTTCLIETKDGESLIGLVVNETESTLTVRQPFGRETVLKRSDIQQVKRQTKSLMPEGLEGGLTCEDVADLIAYINTAQVAKK